jgi:endo-1,4-beta-mannosidase
MAKVEPEETMWAAWAGPYGSRYAEPVKVWRHDFGSFGTDWYAENGNDSVPGRGVEVCQYGLVRFGSKSKKKVAQFIETANAMSVALERALSFKSRGAWGGKEADEG